MSSGPQYDEFAAERHAVAHEEQILRAQEICGYKFRDPLFLKEALQAHTDVRTFVGSRTLQSGNMTLAIVGNTAMKTAMSKEWYSTGLSREIWVRQYASSLLADDYLETVCRVTGLSECMQFPNHGNWNLVGGRFKAKASLVEAIAGAIFLDADSDGIHAVELFMENIHLLTQTRRTLWEHYPEEEKFRILHNIGPRGAWMGW